MRHLNNWDVEKVIKKENILEFDFLNDRNHLSEIMDGYYFLNNNLYDIELSFYEQISKDLSLELNIMDVDAETKTFIRKLNKYNESKDICQSLIGKLAELTNSTIKELHEEMGVDFEDN